ncbi:MAG: hypothetical protein D6766_00580 [Verrucomicrobia bacterium]|nr:MAG: hypothetical protein D6766_00580 [Verrucomicrobiota bacterium]
MNRSPAAGNRLARRFARHRIMTAIENELLAALRALEAAVQQVAAGQPADLAERFARIESLAARLGPETPRDLRHYLAMRSYQKARLWLERAAARSAAPEA